MNTFSLWQEAVFCLKCASTKLNFSLHAVLQALDGEALNSLTNSDSQQLLCIDCDHLTDRDLAAIYFYDTALSFSDSVELIWCRRITPASILYILNRYLTIPLLLLQLIAIAEKDCKVWSSRSRPQPPITIFVKGVHHESSSKWNHLFSAHRLGNLDFYNFDWKLPAIVTSLVLLQFCTLVAWGRVGEYATVLYKRNSLMARLLLNGATYFLVHLVLNILDAVLTATGTFSDTVVFNAIFTPLILSHFFLSIRQAYYATEQQVSTPSQLSSLNFAGRTLAPSKDREARHFESDLNSTAVEEDIDDADREWAIN
ncbi:hypothetical protein DAEQUDRAFT_736771 [Daedalea quercina L-15889]|uniref:DUF6533 domain-containing protein n=1 Tax=Daedalea quercina L-15889 TaxID=1314783 RepID=A0A165RWG2_9APHY|nr:hypothetical protein DAEQUDRAFT_736771 [Daedalea quercina L-15889]